MSNICVVGGSGFIGTRLCHKLTESGGGRVSIVDKADSSDFPRLVKFADVRFADDLKAVIGEGDVIINLAAEHRDDVRPVELYDSVNVGGAKNICEVARLKGIKKIIFTSSVAVYGFAPIGTDEAGEIKPFNAYGRTKYEAEAIYREWQAEQPDERSLVIVRPTVVFGERNRGNVYNLLRQIASGQFLMVGKGKNRKSMAYVENIVAFLEFSMSFGAGIHLYNYVDKPDFTMNSLVEKVNRLMGRSPKLSFRLPYVLGIVIGKGFDLAARLTGRNFAISSIRVKKFCVNSVYNTAVDESGFIQPVSLEQALERTVRYEFIESNEGADVFYTE